MSVDLLWRENPLTIKNVSKNQKEIKTHIEAYQETQIQPKEFNHEVEFTQQDMHDAITVMEQCYEMLGFMLGKAKASQQ